MTTPTSVQHDPLKRIQAWLERHRRAALGVAIALVVAAGAVWFYVSAKERRERFANNALEDARVAAQSGNLPLAASDLSRLVQSYGGTQAADEGTIVMAQIRLLQGDATTAAQELRQALARSLREQFRAPAYNLLGVALEDLGNLTDAGDAYLNAARTSWYDYLAAQHLNDAGRAFAMAGDTTRASQAYQQVLDRYKDSPSALEAQVRLAELTAPHKALGS